MDDPDVHSTIQLEPAGPTETLMDILALRLEASMAVEVDATKIRISLRPQSGLQ